MTVHLEVCPGHGQRESRYPLRAKNLWLAITAISYRTRAGYIGVTRSQRSRAERKKRARGKNPGGWMAINIFFPLHPCLA